jgi:hypothetical protein
VVAMFRASRMPRKARIPISPECRRLIRRAP